MKFIQRLAMLHLGLVGTVLFGFATPGNAQTAAAITGASQGGVGFVQFTNDGHTVNGQIGQWGIAYPYGLNGPSLPGAEPYGQSILYVDVDVNDGGQVTFDYELKSYDGGAYDWYDIYVQTPSGVVSLVNSLGSPLGVNWGTFYDSGRISLSFDLTPYKNQHLRFVFSVEQDGYGDETQGLVSNFSVSSCPVAPLTTLTDATALNFEAGNTVDTADLQPSMQTALACLQSAVGSAGGFTNLNSAYRPPAYQSHLREVWDKWNLLKNNNAPVCASIKTAVQTEFNRHHLLASQQPASANGAHTQGLAIDITSTLPNATFLQLANQCHLYRPVPATDPVHFVHQ
jgi:hypothetical protein